jgi:hypothetical protein
LWVDNYQHQSLKECPFICLVHFSPPRTLNHNQGLECMYPKPLTRKISTTQLVEGSITSKVQSCARKKIQFLHKKNIDKFLVMENDIHKTHKIYTLDGCINFFSTLSNRCQVFTMYLDISHNLIFCSSSSAFWTYFSSCKTLQT